MIIKVCGMRDAVNIKELCQLDIQMIGLNFYKPSSRFISKYRDEVFSQIPSHIKRVGVFVNESLETVSRIQKQYNLDFLQLHGDESVSYCKALAADHAIINVFRVDEHFDMDSVKQYEACASYFLFDTRCKTFGGSGKQFNWEMLAQYEGNVPFLLSGGIGPEHSDQLLNFHHSQFAGIDINSKFETEAAVKNTSVIHTFLKTLNSKQREISS